MQWPIVVGKALVGALVGALVAVGLVPIGVLCGVALHADVATLAPVVGAAVAVAIP